MDNMDNMDTTIIENEEEVSTWVINNKKACMKAFFNPFYDIFDRILVEVVKCKKIEEYIDLETTIIKSTSVSKPGKIPIRLNKPETKVPAVYYFLSLFLIKFAGVQVDNVVEFLLRREYTAAVSLKRIETQYSDLQKKFEDLAKKVENSADSALINGLVIQDLENKIRNLEADVIAKERIILEKNETINSLWEKIKALEKKAEQPTSQVTDMEIDKKTQKKKKRPTNKKRKRARAIAKTGTITDLVIDKGDKDNDYLEKHFADKSRDITFYDIPAYWSDEEILGLLNANVGVVEFINFKRCHKYKTVRTTLRFSKAYEKIYTEGGVNVSLTRNNDRTYFIRMFDSHLPYSKFKEKFRWQALKRLDDDVQDDDISVIKGMVKAFHAFFRKIIRVKGKRFIILYFNKQSDLMSAINKSIETSDIGRGLWIKKENDYIDENGELQEGNRRYFYKSYAPRQYGFPREWEQQDFSNRHSAPSRRHNQW
ncbi:hypothetical protein RhiirB3_446895 [Rhizophagus irregularis]|nr:hypothetical protein RhiirB3_446895 [Rhizophagus irregularis]